MSVAPRWKRRADEIAEAIGDELSINGTVSIGNDVNLSVATITALANAITNVLNPLSIAASVWGVQGDYGVCRATQDPSDQNYWMVYSNIGHQVSHIHYANGTTISPSVHVQYWVYFNNNQWQLFDSDVVRNVSVLSTNITPVHVQVRNLANGFTAMATDISQAMKLSAQPVSVADTVKVKTVTGEAVAITGTVNLNVGSATVPISNPNNITVPVVNTNSVTVPVSLGSVTVPIKATTAGIPQNASGVSVYVPVDGNHSVTVPVSAGTTTVPASVPSGLTVPASVPSGLTVPVANTNAVTVPISGGTSSVPISGGTASVPVENTNNVTVLVSQTGVANVKIVEISAVTPSGGVAPTTAFHEAMETALEDATNVSVVTDADTRTGVIESITASVRSDGAHYMHVRTQDNVLHTNSIIHDPVRGYWLGTAGYTIHAHGYNRAMYIGAKVHQFWENGVWYSNHFSITEMDRSNVPTTVAVSSVVGTVPVSIADTVIVSGGGVRGTVTEAANQGGTDPWYKITIFGKTTPEPTIYGNYASGVFVGLNVVKKTDGTWVPLYQYD